MYAFQVRRTRRAIAVAKQSIDVFGRIDVTPTRSMGLCKCLELFPVTTDAMLTVARPARMLLGRISGRIVRKAKHVLQQRLQAMIRVSLVESRRVFAFE
jgi:hypothetical protein